MKIEFRLKKRTQGVSFIVWFFFGRRWTSQRARLAPALPPKRNELDQIRPSKRKWPLERLSQKRLKPFYDPENSSRRIWAEKFFLWNCPPTWPKRGPLLAQMQKLVASCCLSMSSKIQVQMETPALHHPSERGKDKKKNSKFERWKGKYCSTTLSCPPIVQGNIQSPLPPHQTPCTALLTLTVRPPPPSFPLWM